MAVGNKSNLPRLERSYYQSHAFVFWTLTFEDRAEGWLTPAFHSIFREIMLHASAREGLVCPAYCLMPDHIHLLWMGMKRSSDQLNGMKFVRVQLEAFLAGHRWQHQTHDHVLREHEREHDAFMEVCYYILANPVRKDLAAREADWPFSGAVVPGYPMLHPTADNFWERFWRIYWQQREPDEREKTEREKAK